MCSISIFCSSFCELVTYISRFMMVHLTAVSADKDTFSQELTQHRCCQWLHVISDIQLEPSHKTTSICHSLIKCVFSYWRHYEILVSDENKISLSFCFKAVLCSLWLGLMLHLPLDALLWITDLWLMPVLAECGNHCFSRMKTKL